MRWEETGLDNMVSIKYYFIIRFSHSLSVLQSAAITYRISWFENFLWVQIGFTYNPTLNTVRKRQNARSLLKCLAELIAGIVTLRSLVVMISRMQKETFRCDMILSNLKWGGERVLGLVSNLSLQPNFSFWKSSISKTNNRIDCFEDRGVWIIHP